MRAIFLICSLLVLTACVSTSPEPDAELLQHAQDLALATELVEKADQALYSNDPRSAGYLYEEAIRIYDSPDTWMRLGFVYEKLDDASRALNAYAMVLEKDSQRAEAYQQVGKIYLDRKMLDQANTNFSRALEIDDTLWRSWNGMGIAADLAYEYDQARNYYKMAIGLNPTSRMLWNNIGYSAYLAGDYVDAETAFQEALAIDGGYKPAWINLSLLRARQKDYERAVELLAKVQSDAVTFNDIGYVAMLNGDWETAENLIRRAIKASPRYYPAANRNLEKVLAARSSKNPVAFTVENSLPRTDKGLGTRTTSTAQVAQCADSNFPTQCNLCELADSPPLCMLRFLQGLGHGKG